MQAANSFRKRFTVDELVNTFVSDVGKSSAVGLDKITGEKFNLDLQNECELISRKAFSGTYNFTNYRQVLITKGAGLPPREICIPTIRDKVLLKTISKILEDVYDSTCETPQPQPIIQSLLIGSDGNKYDSYLKFDFSKFYASIDHDALMRILRRKIRKKELLCLIEKAISTPSAPMGVKIRQKRSISLPEGLPISNRLANIFVEEIDRTFLADKTIEYHRYVDDVIILCNANKLNFLRENMKKLAKKLSLNFNQTKSTDGYIATKPYEYLGYEFFNGEASPRQKSINNLENWLEAHLKRWKREKNKNYWEWKLCLRITGCRLTEDRLKYQRYGWLFYFSQSTNAALPHRLDHLLNKLTKRYEVPLPKNLPTFSKSYYEIHYRNGESSYIPVIDLSIPVAKKREILLELYDLNRFDNLDDAEINSIFNKRMIHEAKGLERDIGMIS